MSNPQNLLLIFISFQVRDGTVVDAATEIFVQINTRIVKLTWNHGK